jgi:serine/threonine protein kinase
MGDLGERGDMNHVRSVSLDDVRASLGPFDEIEPIGSRSGSGECWRVRSAGETHLIKLIVREAESWRFEHEVAALQRLHSSRVMRVHTFGTIQTKAGPVPYLRSEFVSGGSLREHMQGASPDDAHLRSFLLELLRGLEELSHNQIVHRDLKPENIILRNGDWNHPRAPSIPGHEEHGLICLLNSSERRERRT